MPKTKISEYSSTAADNTDIDGINLAEGMLPSDVNNAIRELMAQLKDFETGAGGDSVTVGGNLVVVGSTNTIPGFAKLATAQTFTASQRGTVTTDNDLSFDLSVTNNFKATPTGTATLTFTNIASAGGQSGFILLVNSVGYTISAHANTKVQTGALAAISAAGTYLLGYWCDATNVYVTHSGAMA
jgi:hypothetical protein